MGIFTAALEKWIPTEAVRWLLLAGVLLYAGWWSNSVWATVERHYTETTELTYINRHICAGVYAHAKLPIPDVCKVKNYEPN